MLESSAMLLVVAETGSTILHAAVCVYDGAMPRVVARSEESSWFESSVFMLSSLRSPSL